jgi:hypothetical protein
VSYDGIAHMGCLRHGQALPKAWAEHGSREHSRGGVPWKRAAAFEKGDTVRRLQIAGGVERFSGSKLSSEME